MLRCSTRPYAVPGWVWLGNRWRRGGGSACWRAVGGGCDRPECLIFRKFGLSGIHRIARTSDTKVGGWVPPRRIRPPNFGANGPLVGPGQPRTTKKMRRFPDISTFCQELPGLPVPNLRGVRGTPRGVRPPNFGAKGPLVGPGQPRTSQKMRRFPDISTFCQELPGLPVPNLRGSAEPHGGYAHRLSARRGHWWGRDSPERLKK